MHVGIKNKHHDYTLEIARCIEFFFQQYKRGYTPQEAEQQAIQSYGYAIWLNAQRAIFRNINK